MSDHLENWHRRETLLLLWQSFGLKAEVPFKGSHDALLVGGEEEEKPLPFLSLSVPPLTSQIDLLRD